MTASTDDFIPVEEGQEFEASPAYPTVFGVTLTPRIIGILLGVLGLAGAMYILLNLVMPEWNKYQEQQSTLAQKQGQIEQKQAQLKQSEKIKADLAKAKQQQTDVLSLFANEKSLDTLLLDINRQIDASNAQLSPDELVLFNQLAAGENSRLKGKDLRARLKKYVPATPTSEGEVVNDGSLGTQVNGKLKRKVVNVELEGTFDQTESILRNIERLQPLLLVKDYKSTLDVALAFVDRQNQTVRNVPAKLATSFQLQALVPVSPTEAAKAAQPKKK